MDKQTAKALINTAMGREPADLVIHNAEVVDVFSCSTFPASVAIKNGYIASFSPGLEAAEVIDAGGRFLVPGFIDAHCHIESSHLSPSEYSDAVVPQGTTTVVADPHEICNVCGLDGMAYMLAASERTPLSVFLMFPSCVPATAFEHSGAVLEAADIEKYLDHPRVLGLGEMMNYVGVDNADEGILDKLETAWRRGKNIDGHAPSITGAALDAYVCCSVSTDHECETAEELREKVRKGMYIMLRQGTACRNVLQLLPGVDDSNFRRVLFCTDDCQPTTIRNEGALINGIRLAVSHSLDPLKAVSMATLNAATCYSLNDRGAIAPGRRADFFLTKDLSTLEADEVYILGKLVARDGRMIEKTAHVKPVGVVGKMNVKDFSPSKLSLKLSTDRARAIDIIPGGVVTGEALVEVKRDAGGEWVHDPSQDVLKITVIERHHATGNAFSGLIRGYGLKHGAVATSIGHDSHNILTVGDNDSDMAKAVEKLISTGGGITMFQDGKELGTHVLEIAGLMTDATLEQATDELERMHRTSYETLGVNKSIDPFMTLCFMALPVIPKLKITDSGLFDVTKFCFTENSV